MPGFLGRAIILTWGGQQIPGVREKGVTLNGEPINVSSDEDGGWRTLIEDQVGENSVDIAISGVTKNEQLKQDWFAGTRTKAATITFPDGGVISGEFMLATYSDTGPYNDATTFETSLQSTGPVTYTPYS